MVFVLPFTVKIIERNLEYFLFIMGFFAVIVAGVLSKDLFVGILCDKMIYFIALAVLICGVLFRILKKRMKKIIARILKNMSLKLFVSLAIIILGLLSSLITAIIASLVLVEIIEVLPLNRKDKIRVTVFACFSIGLGAVLTPIGEPLSTIVISRLNKDFFFLLRELSVYIIPGIFAMGIFGAISIKRDSEVDENLNHTTSEEAIEEEREEEKVSTIFIRALRIFVFIFALEMLGAGFKSLINNYIFYFNSCFLYWINILSAILDNATLAAAEISPIMTVMQIKCILLGLLISGGILIPGNIPNIITATELKIKSREWAAVGVPIGLILMFIYFIIVFVIKI
jgi:predicted cation transporter